MSGCCGGSGETLVFTCAGAAHCGQVANRAALQLTQEGAAQVFCLAAVAAGIADKVARARRAAVRVAIDGCEDHCARKTLENAGLAVDVHLELTGEGIEKSPAAPRMLRDTRLATTRVKTKLAELGIAPPPAG